MIEIQKISWNTAKGTEGDFSAPCGEVHGAVECVNSCPPCECGASACEHGEYARCNSQVPAVFSPTLQPLSSPGLQHSASSAQNSTPAASFDPFAWLDRKTYCYNHIHSHDSEAGNLAQGMTAHLHVSDLQLIRMYETMNPANRVFNGTPKDDPPAIPTNVLYMVEQPDGKHRITLEIGNLPKPHDSKTMIELRRDGVYHVTSGYVDSSGKCTLVFDHSGYTSHEMTVWLGADSNNNGYFQLSPYIVDSNETSVQLQVKNPANGVVIGPAIVKGLSKSFYNAQLGILNFGIMIGKKPTPHAVALLQIFMDGNADKLLSDKKPVLLATSRAFNAFNGEFSEWLTHNSGAPFNSQGVVNIKEYTWNDKTSMSDLIETEKQFGAAIFIHYASEIASQANAFFANKPDGEIADFPIGGGDYDIPYTTWESWNGKPTVLFGIDGGGLRCDFNSTIGRGRIEKHKVQYTVKKTGTLMNYPYVAALEVIEVRSWGVVTDLYDFNFEAGVLGQAAATAQIGHGNGAYGLSRSNGQFFKTKIHFNKEYTSLPIPTP